jgi:outer membrane protein TolC
LQAARDGAKARLGTAQAAYFPTINTILSYNRATVNIAAGVRPATGRLLERQVSEQSVSNQSFTATLSETLFDSFRREGRVEAARKDVQAAHLDLATTRQNVILNVQQAYYTHLLARRLVQVNQEAVARNLQNLQRAKGFFEAAQARVRVTEANLQVAQRNFLPTLTANANWSYSGQQFPLAPNWTAGVSLTVPVLDPPRFSQLNEVAANLASARANEEATRQSIVLEVQQSYVDLVSAKESIQAVLVLVQQARENLALAQRRYQVGVGPLIDVTDAQLAFTQAESQQIQALVNFKRAEARLRKATGAVE